MDVSVKELEEVLVKLLKSKPITSLNITEEELSECLKIHGDPNGHISSSLDEIAIRMKEIKNNR